MKNVVKLYLSKYSCHLNTGEVWFRKGRFVSSCQIVWYSNGGLKTGLKNPVYGLKCTVFKWSAISMKNVVKLYLSKYSYHLNTGQVWFRKGRFVSSCQIVWYSNGGLKTGLKNPVYGPKCTEFKWSAMSHDFNI